MDRVEISQHQVVSMDNIAPAVQSLRITFVNVFGVAHQDGSWTLAALQPLTVAPGHGRPISGSNVASELRELAARFDEAAVPDNRSKSAGKSN